MSRRQATREQQRNEELLKLTHQLRTAGGESSALMLTGVEGNEGTTQVVAELGRTFANENAGPVGVIDCNWRSPALHRQFGLELAGGLLDAFSEDALPKKSPSGFDRLSVVTAGVAPGGDLAPSPAQLRHLPMLARRSFRLTLFDAPAVFRFHECALLAPLMDGVIVVVEADRTPLEAIARARAELERIGARIVGAVMNRSGRFAF